MRYEPRGTKIFDTLMKRELGTTQPTEAKARALAAWLNARIARSASTAKDSGALDPVQEEIARRVREALSSVAHDSGVETRVAISRPGTRATAPASVNPVERGPQGVRDPAHGTIQSFDGWRSSFRRLGVLAKKGDGLGTTASQLACHMAVHALSVLLRMGAGVEIPSTLSFEDMHRTFYFRCTREKGKVAWSLEARTKRGANRGQRVQLAEGSFSESFRETVRAVFDLLESQREAGGTSALYQAIRDRDGLFSENEAESDSTLYRLNRVVAEVLR